jgi:hypothetical protein
MTSNINQYLMPGFNGLLLNGALELISKNSNIIYNLDDDMTIENKSKIITNIILNTLSAQQITELNKVLTDINERGNLSQETKNKITKYMEDTNINFMNKKSKIISLDEITNTSKSLSVNNRKLLKKIISEILEEHKKENP